MVAAAMLDRLLHRSVVFNINGPSYRMRAHRARAEATRKAVNSRSRLRPKPRRKPRRVTIPSRLPVPSASAPFTPLGRQKYCSDACRSAAYRRRRDTHRPAITVPKPRPRKPITVYECDTCGHRALGEQRCPDCATFMRKIGLGGECPHCDEPVAVTELLDQEVTITN